MSRRLLDYAPKHAPTGTVRFVNPSDTFDYLEITPLANGGLQIRAAGFSGPLLIQPRVSNEIWVTVPRRRS